MEFDIVVEQGGALHVSPRLTELLDYEGGTDLLHHGSQGPSGPQGPKGDAGPPGPAAFVSSDPNNRTTVGGDGGLFTPDITTDPLAHYILAKS